MVATELGRREHKGQCRLRPRAARSCGAGQSVKHVALVTGLKHYLGPFDAYARSGTLPTTPFREEQPRLDVANFYYNQEDEVYAAAKRDGFTWSVHRPHTIIGKAIGNAMNMGSTLAAYASICKELGRPFKFPGSAAQWNGLSDMTDTRVLGKQLVWASTSDLAKNEAYNIVNGDVFRWSWMWPRLAKWFGVEWAGFEGQPVPLEAQMANDAVVWKQMAEKYGLFRTRSRPSGFALAYGSRHRAPDRSYDRHGAEPETWLSRLPEHRGGVPGTVRDPSGGQGHPPDCLTLPSTRGALGPRLPIVRRSRDGRRGTTLKLDNDDFRT